MEKCAEKSIAKYYTSETGRKVAEIDIAYQQRHLIRRRVEHGHHTAIPLAWQKNIYTALDSVVT